jgi:hypothetical protein
MAGEYGEPVANAAGRLLTRDKYFLSNAGASRAAACMNALDGIPDLELAAFVKQAKEDRLAWELTERLIIFTGNPPRLCANGKFVEVESMSPENIIHAARELGLEVSDA